MKRLTQACVLALLLIPGLPAGARAGTYRVAECNADAQVTAPWPVKYDGVGCNRLEPYYDSYNAGSVWSGVSISAPAGTHFSSASFDWHLGQAFSYNAAVYGFGPDGAVAWQASAGTGGPNSGHASLGTLSSVSIQLSCPGPTGSGCGDYGPYQADDVDRVQFGPFTFDVVDTSAPANPSLGGELVDGGRQQGTRSLTIDASDLGGGVSQVAVAVNGLQIDTFPSGCAVTAGVATNLHPCPSSVSRTITVDTSASPWRDGDNALEVCAADLAGSPESPARSCTERTVTVGPPPQPPDTDDDGCADAEETQIGSDPTKPDTDGDGLGDCEEVRAHSCLSPTNRDSDNDGTVDGADPEPCRNEAAGQVAGASGINTGIPRLDECGNRITGGKRRDRLVGTAENDRIVGRQSSDLLLGLGGRNCLLGNTGDDRLRGGPAADFLAGGPGGDRIAARDGVRDLVKCGSGSDRATADRIDLVTGCERLTLR